MARLPDVDSLGARPIPVSNRAVSSVRNAGAVADAVGEVAGQVGQIAQQRIEEQDKLDLGAAQTAYLAADTGIRQQLKDDQDYGSFDKKYRTGMENARTQAASLIKSRSARASFEAEATQAADRGAGIVADMARTKRIDAQTAVGNDALSKSRTVAIESDNEQDRAAAIASGQNVIAGLQANGALSATEAEAAGRKWTEQYRSGRLDYLLAQDRTDEASKLFEAYRPSMNPDDAIRIQQALTVKERASTADWVGDQVDAVLAGTEVGGKASSAGQILHIIEGAESRHKDFAPDGSLLTSPKGAMGRMQVMPATARDPGFGIAPAKDNSPEELARVGREFGVAMIKRYGDPALVFAAYNAGPGNVDKAVAAAKAAGDPSSWLSRLPAETRKYVTNNVAQLGTGVSISAPDGKQTTLRDRLAYADQILTGRKPDASPALHEAVRAEVLRRYQIDRADISQQQDRAESDFRIGVERGTVSAGDVEEAYQAGRISPDARASLIIATDERKKKQSDLENYSVMTSTPGFVFNPLDDTQKKAANAQFIASGGTSEAMSKIWRQTGILPAAAAVGLRGGLVSTDPERVEAAANVAGNMIRVNPNAFAGVEGGSDIETASLAFNHYVYDLGATPEQASQRVAQENSPEFKSKIKLGQPEMDEVRKDIRKDGADVAKQVFGEAAFVSPATSARANDAYADIVISNMRAGKSEATARSIAGSQIKKVFGPTRNGPIMQYPPEAAYPALNGSHDYIYKDAVQTVKQVTQHDTTADDIRFVPIPGLTDQDFRSGKAARYRVLYGYKVDGQTIWDTVPGVFAADAHAAAASISVDRKKQFEYARAALPGPSLADIKETTPQRVGENGFSYQLRLEATRQKAQHEHDKRLEAAHAAQPPRDLSETDVNSIFNAVGGGL